MNLDDAVCQHLGYSADECRRWRLLREAQAVAFWMVFGLTVLILVATL